jgi:hypothetical protein
MAACRFDVEIHRDSDLEEGMKNFGALADLSIALAYTLRSREFSSSSGLTLQRVQINALVGFLSTHDRSSLVLRQPQVRLEIKAQGRPRE